MNKYSFFSTLFFCLVLLSCGNSYKSQTITKPIVKETPIIKNEVMPDTKSTTDKFLSDILEKSSSLKNFLAKKDENNIQIIYTLIERDKDNVPTAKDYFYNYNPSKYFYPASTVKFPASVLALQKLNELSKLNVNKNTTLITATEGHKQTVVLNDPTSENGKPSIAQYIKKILLVSDNDAYNRIYEFLGQRYINQSLNNKGFNEVQLTHRLQLGNLNLEDNKYTNPISFYDNEGFVLYEQPLQFSNINFTKRNDSLGNGYMSGGKLINKPMDFSTKNRIYLNSLHQIMKSVVLPETVSENQKFNITNEDRNFLLKYMSQYPSEGENPTYNKTKTEYYDTYCKFMYYGSEDKPVNTNIRIFNKVGDAYGHILDVAYIIDFEKKIEFMVSAVTYCNSDGILNDDKYEYESFGFPFMKALGTTLYDYEINRKRKYSPNLSEYLMNYDKR